MQGLLRHTLDLTAGSMMCVMRGSAWQWRSYLLSRRAAVVQAR